MKRITLSVSVLIAVAVLILPVISATGCGSSSLSSLTSGGSEQTVVVTASTAPPVTVPPTTAGTAGQGSGQTATPGGFSIDYPIGRLTQPTGDAKLVVAKRQEDLSAARPGGARLVIEISSGGDSNPDSAAILDEVAGKSATLFGLQDITGRQSTISDCIVVALTDERSVMITLEGPADTWAASQTELEGILSTIRFF
jgi:hypothetical protein